jgi:hypothetical protein
MAEALSDEDVQAQLQGGTEVPAVKAEAKPEKIVSGELARYRVDLATICLRLRGNAHRRIGALLSALLTLAFP